MGTTLTTYLYDNSSCFLVKHTLTCAYSESYLYGMYSRANLGRGTVIEFAAGLSAVVAMTLGGLLLRATTKLLRATTKLRATRLALAGYERDRAEALAVLDTVPLAAFRWPAGREQDGYPVRTAPYANFLAELISSDAAQLEAARRAVQCGGRPFSLTLRLCSGTAFYVQGRRTAAGETVLWLLDGSAAECARQAGDEAASLREMIEAIPVPLWRRSRDGTLVDCNRA